MYYLWAQVAPVTAAHIFKLVRMGLYNSNHIFRVDKGFVAQTAGAVCSDAAVSACASGDRSVVWASPKRDAANALATIHACRCRWRRDIQT